MPSPLAGHRPDVVGFGEVLVLLQPSHGEGLATAERFEVHVAGAEFNVCAAVASLGGKSAFCTRLGDDPLGTRVETEAARLGVNLCYTVDTQRPTGVFFKDAQEDGRRRVYYYRSASAASAMTPADSDRGLALSPRAIVVSGLTVALGDGPADMVRQIGSRAAEYGSALVVDVNLRPQLGRQGQVLAVLRELLPVTDLLVVGTDESTHLLGSNVPEEVAHAAFMAGCREVVVKAGADGCWWVDESGNAHHQPSSAIDVVDPVGAGDAFTAGYLSARLVGAHAGAAAKLASDMSARVMAATGDTAGLPSRTEGHRMLEHVSRVPA